MRITLNKMPRNNQGLQQVQTNAERLIANAQDREKANKQEVEINLKNYINYNYIGDLFVGNKPQRIRAIFDTGSTNIWILSKDCKSSRNIIKENLPFDSTQSSTLEVSDLACAVEFGSGKLSGIFVKDDIRIGGTGLEQEQLDGTSKHDVVLIKNQAFGLAKDEVVFDETFEAIVGLAFPQMSNSLEVGQPFFDSLIDQKLLHMNVFAFYMSVSKKDQSELIFGWIDESKYTGNIVWHPVINQFFWQLQLDDVLYNNKSIGYCKKRKCSITPDSGTSTITFPKRAFEKIKQLIPDQKNCRDINDFGQLTKDMFIVGDTFMSYYYSIFNRENNTVGLAKALHQYPIDESGLFD
ncbi:pepsin a-like [Stylonychia lemnae]|uniref:Pepsin a-like n=1 Tax=Stylonychia lemnae TaxID=5949 RepID=A0A077ZYH6_STYLE|nr:pepsin a-like [Stylonychia lemnae]|eukprot:CDW74996.1 pepsin a-like [Stylonychia lemnae]